MHPVTKFQRKAEQERLIKYISAKGASNLSRIDYVVISNRPTQADCFAILLASLDAGIRDQWEAESEKWTYLTDLMTDFGIDASAHTEVTYKRVRQLEKKLQEISK